MWLYTSFHCNRKVPGPGTMQRLSTVPVIRLLFEIIVPLFPRVSPSPCHPGLFSLPLVLTFSSALPRLSQPLKWQSFLRRRPVEAKRGERSTGSSVYALRSLYSASSRCLFDRKNEKNGHRELKGFVWLAIIYCGTLWRIFPPLQWTCR